MLAGAPAPQGTPEAPVGAASTTVRRAAGYDFTCREAGEGRALLMLHGSLCDGRYFAMQMAAFGRRFHAIAPSLRHCHPARWDGRGAGYSIERHVLDMAALIATIGGPVHLLGHSRGARVAFGLASRYPALVEKLVLAEPGGPVDAALAAGVPDLMLAPHRATLAERAARMIGAGDVDGGLALFIDAVNGPGAFARLPARAKAAVRDNAGTLRGQARETATPLTRAAAAAIAAPTLIVTGALSPPPFAAIADALAGAMPQSRRSVIAGASHTMNTTGADLFNRAVLAFLAAERIDNGLRSRSDSDAPSI